VVWTGRHPFALVFSFFRCQGRRSPFRDRSSSFFFVTSRDRREICTVSTVNIRDYLFSSPTILFLPSSSSLTTPQELLSPLGSSQFPLYMLLIKARSPVPVIFEGILFWPFLLPRWDATSWHFICRSGISLRHHAIRTSDDAPLLFFFFSFLAPFFLLSIWAIFLNALSFKPIALLLPGTWDVILLPSSFSPFFAASFGVHPEASGSLVTFSAE